MAMHIYASRYSMRCMPVPLSIYSLSVLNDDEGLGILIPAKEVDEFNDVPQCLIQFVSF